MVDLAVILLLSYLFGSIPTSILAGRLMRGIDIREHGSGNAGATNTFRVLGWKAGLAVAVIDVAKGLLTVLLVARIRIGSPPGDPLVEPESLLFILSGCAAIAGHIFPVFARFRGGKGVATGAGVVFALQPLVAACCLVTFISVVSLSGYVSLGSIAASVMLPLSYVLITLLRGQPWDAAWLIFCGAIALVIISMHRKNIGRLWRGSENRFDGLRLFRGRRG